MTAVWLDCPKHGYVQNNDLVDIAPGADATFEKSMGRCPVDGNMVPIVDAKYVVSPLRVVKLEAFDDQSAEQIRKLREAHPDA